MRSIASSDKGGSSATASAAKSEAIDSHSS